MTARYEPAIDTHAVDAIDFHTHVEIDGAGHCAYDDELTEATGRYFKLGGDYFARVDDLAEHYRQHNTAAVARVRELTGDYGVRGFKFHPSLQGFEPNDRRFFPIYEAIAAAGVPALFHTGQTSPS